MMKKKLRLLYIFLILIVASGSFLGGCHATYYRIPIAKPKSHLRPYDTKRDSRKKRTKVRKYKSLKSTRKIHVD